MKNRYLVEGNFKQFGNIVKCNDVIETMAVSPEQARNNATYRVKKQLGLSNDSKLTFTGKVTKLE